MVQLSVAYCTQFCLHGSIGLENKNGLVFPSAFELFSDLKKLF